VMSGASAKRDMETGEKAISHRKALSRESGAKGKAESPPRVKSLRSSDKKKKIKKVVYYETDSSSPSTSGSDAASVTSKRHERKKYSKMPLHYPHISKRAPLLSVPLGKPPYFDGEDYCMSSDKMRHHLTSLHASIWDIVEFGAQVPTMGDEGYDSDEVAQIRQAVDDRGGARSIRPQPRRGATSDVQPAQDLGQSSAQPWEHKMG
jgi:hypothetical protein